MPEREKLSSDTDIKIFSEKNNFKFQRVYDVESEGEDPAPVVDSANKEAEIALPVRCDHKTVFLIDHTKWFAEDSNCSVVISVKGSSENNTVAHKSLWSCTIEALLEFHRIVNDLFFDSDRLLRVCAADLNPVHLQKHWDRSILKYEDLTQDLSLIMPPTNDGDDCTVIDGIGAAVDALGEISFQQRKLREKQLARKKQSTHNGGSIVVVCRLRNIDDVRDLEKRLAKEIFDLNSEALEYPKGLKVPLERVNFFIVGYSPNGNSSFFKYSQDKIEESAFAFNVTDKKLLIRSRVETVADSYSLSHVVRSFGMEIYDLVSTTVTGIPMKEEANQGQSVNYDVELIHPRESHKVLEYLGLCGEGGSLREKGNFYCTHKLAWSTPSPKNKWQLFPRTMSALRVTPSNFNSRPSVCLTSFLMGGRNVMLELKKESNSKDIKPNVGQKLITHTLISHMGRIYIHAIDIIPNNMESVEGRNFQWPSTMSENCDSDDDEDEDFEPAYATMADISELENVTEEEQEAIMAEGSLRTEDLAALIKKCMLRPRKKDESVPEDVVDVPCGQAIKHIRQITRYWPTTKEDSLIFQTTKFNDLISIFRKTTLTPADIEQGKKAIARAYALKTAKELLLKGNFTCNLLEEPKNKEEQYRVAYFELATYVANYIHYSENHEALYKELLTKFELDQQITVNPDDVPMGYDEIPSCENFITEKNAVMPPPSEQRSRSSSPVPKKVKKSSTSLEKINVYDYLCGLQPKIEERADFVGREEAGTQPAKLYKNLDLTTAPPRGQEAPM